MYYKEYQVQLYNQRALGVAAAVRACAALRQLLAGACCLDGCTGCTGWLAASQWLIFQVRQGNISLAARRPVEIYMKGTAPGSDRIYLARTTAEQACGCM